ncbi:glycosyltransferase family 2 protein [Enterococcus faecium]|uniref:glycosyltransferase family 2 protein n=1 Tax=Enterococcus TaxID=1350 RepID=UPI000B73870B|nr:glycosyltransferase family 2 protein [Enterococcus faecium]NTK68305.1 glycosyltransferase family 2 protein [Enterococcus faecium]OTN70441.1 hypothetical protein A5827_000807 [Enterococcus faecium]UQR32313.1 glycosyltransferase [Enterococcus faecium]
MFDVIIPTKNRLYDLQNLINSIGIQTLLPKKIIIVDQSEKILHLNLSNIPSQVEIIHLHNNEISGLSAAKNYGISKSTSEIIFFFDDDLILDSDFFEKMIEHFVKNPEYIGICGRQKNSKSSKIKIFFFSLFHVGKFKDIRKKCNSGYIKEELVRTNILPGGITGYRREVFDNYLFDEVLVRYCLGEDMDFSYRVSQNNNLAFATNALALHNHSTVGRYDSVESFACKLAGYTYFFKKNMTTSFLDRISYSMVKMGIYVDAIVYTLMHKNLDAFRGIIKGKKYVLDNFKGVPFIDYEKFIGLGEKK